MMDRRGFGPLRNWFFTESVRSGTTEATIAITRIQKEINRVKAPGQIQVFTPEQLQFVDVDNNTVDIQKSGTDLLLDGNPLARNVQSLAFTYLDKDGNVATVKGLIRFIRVKLVMTSGNQTIRLQSAERIRNL
jgi:hypothetical protein